MRSFRPTLVALLAAVAIFAILKQSRETLFEAFPNPVFEIFLYSFPNFAEGIVGFLMTAMLLTQASWKVELLGRFFTLPRLCIVTTLGVGTYVITQELGLHHVGGAQVYDPYDIAFSIAGLIIFMWLGPKEAP
ncbi:MAG: hypothetical protein ABJK59_08725 [Erythrobacter sp.]|uniref:hypothetical protein n=1 Tax=Erythrobacter sp. TaxID=1042 RepID=UPI0032998D4D